MKKTWQAPRILVQEFEANEYVAACYDLFCAISGDGYGGYKGVANFYQDKYNWGPFDRVPCDGLQHGEACAKGSSYDQETGLFYEVNKPGSKVESSSVNISDTPSPNGVGVYATWISINGSNSDRYQHYGYAVENMKGHPNHS